ANETSHSYPRNRELSAGCPILAFFARVGMISDLHSGRRPNGEVRLHTAALSAGGLHQRGPRLLPSRRPSRQFASGDNAEPYFVLFDRLRALRRAIGTGRNPGCVIHREAGPPFAVFKGWDLNRTIQLLVGRGAVLDAMLMANIEQDHPAELKSKQQ